MKADDSGIDRNGEAVPKFKSLLKYIVSDLLPLLKYFPCKTAVDFSLNLITFTKIALYRAEVV